MIVDVVHDDVLRVAVHDFFVEGRVGGFAYLPNERGHGLVGEFPRDVEVFGRVVVREHFLQEAVFFLRVVEDFLETVEVE